MQNTDWPWSYTKGRLKNYMYKIWDEKWKNTPGHKHTKFFYGSPNPQKARGITRLSRSKLRDLYGYEQ